MKRYHNQLVDRDGVPLDLRLKCTKTHLRKQRCGGWRMNIQNALDEIQKMNASETVTRDSIIGWYNFYKRKLRAMSPERSMFDTLYTIGVWMKLTDKGNSPGFPYSFKTDIDLSQIDQEQPKMKKLGGLLNLLSPFITIAGIVISFINILPGIIISVFGLSLVFVGYHLSGGRRNIDLYYKDTDPVRRAFLWVQKQHI